MRFQIFFFYIYANAANQIFLAQETRDKYISFWLNQETRLTTNRIRKYSKWWSNQCRHIQKSFSIKDAIYMWAKVSWSFIKIVFLSSVITRSAQLRAPSIDNKQDQTSTPIEKKNHILIFAPCKPDIFQIDERLFHVIYTFHYNAKNSFLFRRWF